jgi:hypothetical protein
MSKHEHRMPYIPDNLKQANRGEGVMFEAVCPDCKQKFVVDMPPLDANDGHDLPTERPEDNNRTVQGASNRNYEAWLHTDRSVPFQEWLDIPSPTKTDDLDKTRALDTIQRKIWARINDEANMLGIKLTIGDAYALGSVVKDVLHPEVSAYTHKQTEAVLEQFAYLVKFHGNTLQIDKGMGQADEDDQFNRGVQALKKALEAELERLRRQDGATHE